MKVTSVQTWKGKCLAEISRKRKAGKTSDLFTMYMTRKKKKIFYEGLTAIYMKICTSWNFPLYSTLHCPSWMSHTTAVLCYTVGTYACSDCPSWLSVITIIIQAYLLSGCIQVVQKITYCLHNAHSYHVKWQPPKTHFTNYTIHGCVVII